MATSICSRVSSCWVLRSTKTGHVGLHCGHWQVSTRWKGHPLAGVRLLRVASRLRSQQYRAREREMPRTWKLSQLLGEEKNREISGFAMNRSTLSKSLNNLMWPVGGLPTTGIYPERTHTDTRGRRCRDLYKKAQLKARTIILWGDFNQVANGLFFSTQHSFNKKHHQVRASKEELRSCSTSWVLESLIMSVLATPWWVCRRGQWGKVWGGVWWHGECRWMFEWAKTATWAHSSAITLEELEIKWGVLKCLSITGVRYQ